MIGVGAMIGAGIFVLTGSAVGRAGPAALLAFGLNGILTLFTALSYAELASSIPEAGGGYAYMKKVMPNSIAFISGWMLWFAYVVACALYARGFGSYFVEFLNTYTHPIGAAFETVLTHGGTVALFTLLIGVLFLAVNIVGTHATGKTENVITLAKIAILAVFIVFGLIAVFRNPSAAVVNYRPFLPNGFSGILAAMGLIFIAFEGYDLIATVSEEVQDPRRNIPRAILLSLGITLAIYMTVVFTMIGATPSVGGVPTWQALGQAGERGIIEAAKAFMPRFGVVLILGGGVFATLSALNATVMASSRVAFAMGRDWMLPNRLSRLHAVRKTPVLAITVTGALFLGIAVALPLETIGSASSLLFLLTFMLVNIALIVYRRRSEPSTEGFRVPLFPLTPVLGTVTTAGLAVFLMANDRAAGIMAVVWIAVGFIVFRVFFRNRVRIADVPRVIETPSLLDLRKTKRYRTLVPISHPGRIEGLIRMASGVAKVSRGDVIALRVLELPDVTSYEEGEEFIDEAQTVLASARRLTLKAGIPFSSVVRVGRTIGPEIVAVAKEQRCDLILLGYKADEEVLENSIIHHVVTKQPCDVAVLRAFDGQAGPFRKVLLPLGGKEVHDRLKSRIVHALAAAGPVDLTFLTVIQAAAGPATKRHAEETLRNAANIYAMQQAAVVVVADDDVPGAILKAAEDADLVILGMRDEPWLRSFFFGPLAHQVAGRLGCPTLLTKTYSQDKSRLKRVLPW